MFGRLFSPHRFWAMVFKELVQMKRDRLTFGMMVGIPLMQLVLFGFAINSNPKNLPTAVLSEDQSVFSRSIVSALQNSEFFKITHQVTGQAKADRLLSLGEVQFVLQIPTDFARKLIKNEKPKLLLEADGTDSMAVAHAVSAMNELVESALKRDLRGPLAYLRAPEKLVDLTIHARYNPEGLSRYDIVPGLMGVVLTMTLVIITSLAITRESERHTMEHLLTTPLKPLEIMLGKLTPYIVVGYLQMALIIFCAKYIFSVPVLGSLALLFLVSLIFIAANLAVGLTFSTVAKNQLQAVQMSFFFFLPSILLSGFMFPFRGMPQWAQALGTVLPLTHYLRLVRGIILKGNTLNEIWVHVIPMAVFMVLALTIALLRFRKTLD